LNIALRSGICGMLCRLLCAAAMLCLAANLALAQDPTKVEPKHYKMQFENDRVQVVNVHYGPHEKSEMHEHPGGVSVSVTGGHLRFTDQNGKVTDVFAKAGEARWFPPFKHKVENLGDEPYNGVYIGIKGKLSAAGSDPQPGSPVSAEQIAQILADSAQVTVKH
jgi:quercetin dioxygenase-like cupin family protein